MIIRVRGVPKRIDAIDRCHRPGLDLVFPIHDALRREIEKPLSAEAESARKHFFNSSDS